MSYWLTFSKQAEEDLIDSIKWYNQQKENLGFEFYDCGNENLLLIVESPQRYSVRFKNIRTAPVKRFPYLIYFYLDQQSDSIIILGVLHTSRNPETIKKRK